MAHHVQTIGRRRRACYIHFARRLNQRVSGKLNAKVIWSGISDAIQRGDTTFVNSPRRLNKTGRRLWRVDAPKTHFFIIYDHELGCAVTVLAAKGYVQCHRDVGGEKISLEEQL